ncbi:MAG: hypothetical protein ACLUVG_12135 [Phocaeicola vulgatus]
MQIPFVSRYLDDYYTRCRPSLCKECWLEGAVDYFYGGGNALVEESTLYNVRSGSVIVAPCHESVKYGYVFRNCVIDGNEQAADGKLKLGRPLA